MYDRFFWAGCRIGLRRNTCADRLKSSFIIYVARPNSGHFFWKLKLILKLAQSHLDVPLLIFRCGVLRQGFDKFYSLSFQAILSLFFSSLTPHSPES